MLSELYIAIGHRSGNRNFEYHGCHNDGNQPLYVISERLMQTLHSKCAALPLPQDSKRCGDYTENPVISSQTQRQSGADFQANTVSSTDDPTSDRLSGRCSLRFVTKV